MIPVPSFKSEADLAALNEACAGNEVECTIEQLCPYCKALSKAIELRLIRAFLAGQDSVKSQFGLDLKTPHRA